MAGGRCPAGKKRPKGASDSEVCITNSKSKAYKNSGHQNYYKPEATPGAKKCRPGFRKSKKNAQVCVRKKGK